MKAVGMKRLFNLLLISLMFYAQPSQAWWFFSANYVSSTQSEVTAVDSTQEDATPEDNKTHNDWLKSRFSEQHQQLTPVVAVADIFFTCNQIRKTDASDYDLSFLITQMDRDTLAEKLSLCLGDDTMQSDVALNFGLLGCFHAQLAHLPKVDRDEKMVLVKQAIASLSHEERKKSFTQCVTEQSIHYLK